LLQLFTRRNRPHALATPPSAAAPNRSSCSQITARGVLPAGPPALLPARGRSPAASQASVDFWFSEGDKVIRFRASLAGTDASGRDVVFKMEADITDINAGFSIDPPD
jgi:hypothetical protein